MRRSATHLALGGLLFVLGGCAAGAESSGASPSAGAGSAARASGSASSSTGQSAEVTDRAVEIAVSVRDGAVSPRSRRVEVAKDSQVRLLVTSDIDDTVHVHGFGIEEPVEAGRTTTVEFVADEDGVFEVETHDSELELVQLEVR